MKTDAAQKMGARVRAALADQPSLVEKKMMGGTVFMVNGAMCCSVNRGTLLVRIDPGDRDQLLSKPHVKPMKMGARTMKGFVRIGPNGLRTKASLAGWLKRGLNSARTP